MRWGLAWTFDETVHFPVSILALKTPRKQMAKLRLKFFYFQFKLYYVEFSKTRRKTL